MIKENNSMRKIRIEKVTLNIGCGKTKERLEKAIMLLKELSGMEPKKTFAKKRIPTWGLRPGLAIGCKVTFRGNKAKEMIKRLLDAVNYELTESQITEGNVSFGIQEYIDIPGIKYSPEIGIMGLQCSITLERPGFRIEKRIRKRSRIGTKHRITKEETIEFMKNEFGIRLVEEK